MHMSMNTGLGGSSSCPSFEATCCKTWQKSLVEVQFDGHVSAQLNQCAPLTGPNDAFQITQDKNSTQQISMQMFTANGSSQPFIAKVFADCADHRAYLDAAVSHTIAYDWALKFVQENPQFTDCLKLSPVVVLKVTSPVIPLGVVLAEELPTCAHTMQQMNNSASDQAMIAEFGLFVYEHSDRNNFISGMTPLGQGWFSQPEVHSVDCCLLDPFNRGAPGIASGLAKLALRADSQPNSDDCWLDNTPTMSSHNLDHIKRSDLEHSTTTDDEGIVYDQSCSQTDTNTHHLDFSKNFAPVYEPVYEPHSKSDSLYGNIPAYTALHDSKCSDFSEPPRKDVDESDSLYGNIPAYTALHDSKCSDFSEPPRYPVEDSIAPDTLRYPEHPQYLGKERSKSVPRYGKSDDDFAEYDEGMHFMPTTPPPYQPLEPDTSPADQPLEEPLGEVLCSETPQFEESDEEECAWCPGSPTGRQGTDLMAAKSSRQALRRSSIGGDGMSSIGGAMPESEASWICEPDSEVFEQQQQRGESFAQLVELFVAEVATRLEETAPLLQRLPGLIRQWRCKTVNQEGPAWSMAAVNHQEDLLAQVHSNFTNSLKTTGQVEKDQWWRPRVEEEESQVSSAQCTAGVPAAGDLQPVGVLKGPDELAIWQQQLQGGHQYRLQLAQ